MTEKPQVRPAPNNKPATDQSHQPAPHETDRTGEYGGDDGALEHETTTKPARDPEETTPRKAKH